MQNAQLYPETTLSKLEYDKIIHLLLQKCISPMGAYLVKKMEISCDYAFIFKALNQVNEFKSLLEFDESFPTDNYLELSDVLNYFDVNNSVLSEEQFLQILLFLLTIRDIFHYFKKREKKYPHLEALLKDDPFKRNLLTAIAETITEEGEVRAGVSAELDRIRREIRRKEKELDKAFNALLTLASAQGWLESGQESIKNGRRVLTVLSEHKRKVRGIIHDESATGKTVFIEPEVTVELSNDFFELKQEERREIFRILRDLTEKLRPEIPALRFYQQMAGIFDFIRAKALLAMQIKATLPEFHDAPIIVLRKAIHPLLFLHNDKVHKKVIPLTVELDPAYRILVISGPNAGGKSVTLKTVGLLQLMLQSGMLVPVSPDSVMGIFRKIYVELGDEQSIENELSTYSSRLRHMKYFIENADGQTLFFADEFGTGTDPRFGGAVAETILSEINDRKAFGVVTTHYSNIKLFATNTPGLINGSMAFDTKTLNPLYSLKLGQPGSSYTFEIAQKIGLSTKIINKAKGKVDSGYLNFDSLLATLETEKEVIDLKAKRLEKNEKELDNLIASYVALKDELDKSKKKIIGEAKQKSLEQLEHNQRVFSQLVKDFKKKTKDENAIIVQNELNAQKEKLNKEIEEIKAQKQKTKNDIEIKAGSIVNLEGGKQSGVVEEIRKNKAVVAFGNARTLVNINDLEATALPDNSISKKVGNLDIGKISQEFSPNIDLRGMRADEALQEVEKLLDNAIILSQPFLRILHGKGDGILRQRIRALLKKYDFVKDFKSEEPQHGGDGVTLVELK